MEASISNLASSSSSSGNSFPGRWVCTNVQANSTTFKSGCLYTSGPSLTNTPFTCADYTTVSKLTTSKRLDSGSSNSGSYAEGLKDPMSVELLTMQMVFFCLLLMARSCQAFHKKRSIMVHFVLRRSLLTDVFAKYSYTFCLFALPVLLVYYPAWVKMVPPILCRSLAGFFKRDSVKVCVWKRRPNRLYCRSRRKRNETRGGQSGNH